MAQTEEGVERLAEDMEALEAELAPELGEASRSSHSSTARCQTSPVCVASVSQPLRWCMAR